MMTKHICAFLAVVCFNSFAYGEVLRIATFNCEFLVRKKVHVKFDLPFRLKGDTLAEWNEPGVRDANFTLAAKAVARVIKTINADIIVLTEVGDDADVLELHGEVTDLGLDYPHMLVGKSADGTTGQHVALFSKLEITNPLKSLPGRECYDQELDDPETEKDTGVSKGLRGTVEFQGQQIHMFGAHFTSEGGGHEQDAQRIAQASIVRRHYLPLLTKGEHVIVAGDLNDRRGQPAIRRVRGRDDIHPDLIQTGITKYFPREKIDTRWTYEFQGERQQIDHILLSLSIKNACKRGGISTEVIPVTETIGDTDFPASDHRALAVNLDFQ